jgi:DNA-binding response OmpR family regulator
VKKELKEMVAMSKEETRLMEKSRALALSAGANDYITKPFDMIDLVVRIEAIFNQCLLS